MIFASNNNNKIEQVKQYLTGFEIKGLKESGIDIDINEDQPTFVGNASKKAMEIYNLTKQPVIADDSGLCIDEFNGWPGVATHRFLENSTASSRNEYILEKMKDIPNNKRTCSVECAIAYVDQNGKLYVFEGKFNGYITTEQKGDNFFGFDSIVAFDESLEQTFAMLNDEQKLIG